MKLSIYRGVSVLGRCPYYGGVCYGSVHMLICPLRGVCIMEESYSWRCLCYANVSIEQER